MSKHSSPHDWLNLVQMSGLLVNDPVLATAFPDGSERMPSYLYTPLRARVEMGIIRAGRGAD